MELNLKNDVILKAFFTKKRKWEVFKKLFRINIKRKDRRNRNNTISKPRTNNCNRKTRKTRYKSNNKQ